MFNGMSQSLSVLFCNVYTAKGLQKSLHTIGYVAETIMNHKAYPQIQ